MIHVLHQQSGASVRCRRGQGERLGNLTTEKGDCFASFAMTKSFFVM